MGTFDDIWVKSWSGSMEECHWCGPLLVLVFLKLIFNLRTFYLLKNCKYFSKFRNNIRKLLLTNLILYLDFTWLSINVSYISGYNPQPILTAFIVLCPSSALWITHSLLVCRGLDSHEKDWPGMVGGLQAEFVCCWSHNVPWGSDFVVWERCHTGEAPFLSPHIRVHMTAVCLTSGSISPD